MSSNIEIKARVRSVAHQQQLAAALSDTPVERIEQIDTFFHVPRGRLKLREAGPDSAELIHYERADRAGPKKSDYVLCPTTQPQALREILTALFDVRGTVRKTRHLYRVGQTRIHVDDVAGLGWFIELEVVLTAEQTDREGAALAAELNSPLQKGTGSEPAGVDGPEGRVPQGACTPLQRTLKQRLDIRDEDLIAGAYIDLLEAAGR